MGKARESKRLEKIWRGNGQQQDHLRNHRLRRGRGGGHELVLAPEPELANVIGGLGVRMKGLVENRIDSGKGAEKNDTNEQAAKNGAS